MLNRPSVPAPEADVILHIHSQFIVGFHWIWLRLVRTLLLLVAALLSVAGPAGDAGRKHGEKNLLKKKKPMLKQPPPFSD